MIEKGDNVFLVKLVKSPLRKISRSIGWAVGCLVLLGGCVPRVNLPAPSPFPAKSVGAPETSAYLAQLEGYYSREQSAVWDQFAQCWGVKQAWGRLLYRVRVVPNQAPRCELVRMSLHFQKAAPTHGWKKLLSLQRDGLLTVRDTYQFTTRIAQERKILRPQCVQACPFRLPAYQGNRQGEIAWLIARERSELPPEQHTPPSPRALPPARLMPPAR